jgi:hypothetical protein
VTKKKRISFLLGFGVFSIYGGVKLAIELRLMLVNKIIKYTYVLTYCQKLNNFFYLVQKQISNRLLKLIKIVDAIKQKIKFLSNFVTLLSTFIGPMIIFLKFKIYFKS